MRQNGIITLTLVRPDVGAHAQQRRALEGKPFGIAIVVVSRRAAEADHRILFRGLEFLAAKQSRVLVRLEIAHAHDDRLGIERRGDARDAFAEAADEEAACVLGADPSGDRRHDRRILEMRVADQRHRMNADVIRDDELCPREPDALIGNSRQVERAAGVADDEHHLRVRVGHAGDIDAVDLKGTRPA